MTLESGEGSLKSVGVRFERTNPCEIVASACALIFPLNYECVVLHRIARAKSRAPKIQNVKLLNSGEGCSRKILFTETIFQ